MLSFTAPQDVDWSECSGPVFVQNGGGAYGNGDASLDPIQYVLPKVIEATNRVLVANGDYDFEILTNGTLLSIQNMTWNGALGFQQAPSTPIDLQLPDLQWQDVFVSSGLGGYDGPGQGIMYVFKDTRTFAKSILMFCRGVQHYERGLMWAETYQSGEYSSFPLALALN
jgi:carboxypeptidase D